MLSARPRLQRPQSTPIHVPSVGAPTGQARFVPQSKSGLRDLQAIDDIQEFLRDSLVQTPPGELDSQRDQLADHLSRLHQQFSARGTAVRWLVWTRWYGEETTSPTDLVGDFLDTRGNRVWFSIAMHQWVRDVEDLLLDAVDTKQAAIECFSGALAFSTLREICGSWMFVRSDGHLNLADVRIRAVDESQPIEEQIESWQHDEARQPIAPVRRILQPDGPQIDLQTGSVVNASFSINAIVKLLNMSRRSLDFLAQANEVMS